MAEETTIADGYLTMNHAKFGTKLTTYNRAIKIPYRNGNLDNPFISESKARCPTCYFVCDQAQIDEIDVKEILSSGRVTPSEINPFSEYEDEERRFIIKCAFCKHRFIILASIDHDSLRLVSPDINI